MKPMYKILLILFLIPFTITATNNKGKYTKNKVITKEFKVNKNASLNVINKYGNIDIVTWSENRIVIKVSITTSGNDEDYVKKRLDQIDVEFDAGSNSVSAETIIEKQYSSWSFWGKRNNVSMEINYTIKMPVTNNVHLNNDYGAISIDKLEGSSKINCDYGSLIIGELLSSNNTFNIDYINKSTIEFVKEATINADYTSLSIEKSEKIKLNADYSNISIEKVSNLNYNCDYGSLKVGESDNIYGRSDYMPTTIENINSTGDFDIDYGSLKINEVNTNFKKIKINSSYTNVKIKSSQNTSFNVVASLSYGGFKYDDGFTFNKEITKSTSKYYEGYHNSPNSNSIIEVDSSYGSISFLNN